MRPVNQGLAKQYGLDVVGVGIGPANMSVAALLEPVDDVRGRFFDGRPEFSWHPGMLFPEATIQNFFLKDLVTLAAPTSPYSFLSFLLAKRRIYRYVSAGLPRVKRTEFEQYFRWVAESLPDLCFGRPVESIDYDGKRLLVEAGDETIAARHLVLGTGIVPRIPAFARPHLGSSLFHVHHYADHFDRPAGKRVAIIGGGQSGAEVLRHILSDSSRLPREVYWITRRSSFLPLDDSPFTEEIFTPTYSDYFFSLSQPWREQLLESQRMASDGISTDLLNEIYVRLYDLEFNEGAGRICRLYPESELTAIEARAPGWRLQVEEHQTGNSESLEVDLVILATGFKYQVPPCLDRLRGRLSLQGEQFNFREDFSIEWEGEDDNKIFVQNAARHCRGIPDPNLSLLAWRSAKIVNSLAGRTVYDVAEASSVFDWRRQREEPAEALLAGVGLPG